MNIESIRREHASLGELYHEFLRVPDLSLGLYCLGTGETDPQGTHDQDEVYYVLKGRSKFRLGEQVLSVRAGDVIYVPKHVEHKFVEIDESLELLVFFAPAET